MTGKNFIEKGAALMEKDGETKGGERQMSRNFFFIYNQGKRNYQADRC
jgi:hypothetical protein